jgi:hypothetical protein
MWLFSTNHEFMDTLLTEEDVETVNADAAANDSKHPAPIPEQKILRGCILPFFVPASANMGITSTGGTRSFMVFF